MLILADLQKKKDLKDLLHRPTEVGRMSRAFISGIATELTI